MINQVSPENWKIEDYKPVAGIGYTPAELAQTYKIAFHRGVITSIIMTWLYFYVMMTT